MSLSRRHLLVASATLPGLAWAHHGWSSFDLERPWYLAGAVQQVRWTNPHAELLLRVEPGLVVPPELAARALPRQTAPVDGAALLQRARVPEAAAGDWTVELAPLTRLQAWSLEAPASGSRVEVLGFAQRQSSERMVRTEYLFIAGRVVGLRSSPA